MFEQKFAKSIVRECCEWIDGRSVQMGDETLVSESFIIANIKGHFGVEQ